MTMPGPRAARCVIAALLLVMLDLAAQAQSLESGYRLDGTRCGEGPLAFPRLPIGVRAGMCAGLVASREDGLVFPRSLVQVPGTRFLVVADMGGWSPGLGRLLRLDPEAPEGARIKVLIGGLDLPHGLAVGIDRRIYAGTVDRIFRFDPLAEDPAATVETILRDLPGLKPRLSDGTQLARNLHPLKAFVFDRTGRLYVNVGAPSDACAKRAAETRPCAEGEGARALAAVWAFTPPAGGIFPTLAPGEPGPPHEVFARGLRNSMALAVHRDFPAPGFAFLQAENARDLPDRARPNEEINALAAGRHYGWPYCYDLATPAPEYRAFLRKASPYRGFCGDPRRHARPHTLLPPHAAPLGMLYYAGERFPELAGRLLVALHGYQPTGSRLIAYAVDAQGFPVVAPPPVRYGVSCARPARVAFRTDREVAAAPFQELVGEWHAVAGTRPQGAPVGLAVAEDGAIWLAEDKNQTIIRIDRDPTGATVRLPCGGRGATQVARLAQRILRDAGDARRIALVRARVIEPHCRGCHADFGLAPGMSEAAKDRAVLAFMLAQDGWIAPGDAAAGRLHARLWGKGAEKVMPANGRELVAGDTAYRAALEALDELVTRMRPVRR